MTSGRVLTAQCKDGTDHAKRTLWWSVYSPRPYTREQR